MRCSMQSTIRVLDENTINKIAAGEVIENPSSVVKELVDNSIDSGATEICVEITSGGRQLIRVTDNGCGMSSDDAVLCLERHATSKIKSVDDILTITSMGFRGEAIPSIASISKFTLLTCPKGAEENGSMVIVEGGRIVKVCEAVRSQGTTIEVKSLFYNVPVRRKFQRSPNYDSNEILKMLNKLALAHPDIKMELVSNQKHLLETKRPVGDDVFSQMSQRVTDVLGDEFMEQCCPVDNVYEGIEVQGYIGLPAYTRHNRTGQYIFINRRPVFSPLIHNAVREGYSTTLQTNRHPLFVLQISMAGDLVDVNVHPQKKEVRLRQEQMLKRAVTQSVDKALHSSGVAPVSFDIAPSSEREDCIFDQKGFGGVPLVHEAMFEKRDSHQFTPPAFEPSPFIQVAEERVCVDDSPVIPQDDASLFSAEEPKRPKAVVMGTIPGYIILDGSSLEGRDGCFFLVDQKAAHSRVVFESLLEKNRHQSIEIQQLLVPVTLELMPEEAAMLHLNIELLVELGIGIKEFGKNSFMIDAIPTIFGDIDLEALVHELIHSLGLNEQKSIEGELEKKLATLASRLSLSRQVKMSHEEAGMLVGRLLQCKHPYQSPTGQHTFTSFSQQELSKRFQ
jgi:DNA mismatch repair protein MutL